VTPAIYDEFVDLLGDSTDLSLDPRTIRLADLYGLDETTMAAQTAWWSSRAFGPP